MVPGVGWLALTCAVGALVCAVLPGVALFISMGLALVSLGVGAVAFRRRRDPGSARLAGAGALFLGTVAAVLGAARYGLILAVVERLNTLF